MTRSIDVTIHNEISKIAAIRDALDRLGQELGVPTRALVQLQVALDEVVSNIIRYSWSDDGGHQVLVRITVEPSGVSLDIYDDGRPFDPRQAPPPEPSPPGQRPRPGGVGIQMVWKLVDGFAYERTNGLNHTRLTKICAVGKYSEGISNDQ